MEKTKKMYSFVSHKYPDQKRYFQLKVYEKIKLGSQDLY